MALAKLLGFDLCPRLKALKDRHLFMPRGTEIPENLRPICHVREFGHETVAGVDIEEIVSQLEVFRPDGTPRPFSEAPPVRALAGEVVRDEEQMVRIPRTGELRHRQVSCAPFATVAARS